MKDLDVGSLPICGEDNRLKGMLTDRDIVINCLAEGGDPRTATAGEFGEGKPVTIGADDSIEEAIWTMQDHQVPSLLDTAALTKGGQPCLMRPPQLGFVT